MRWRIKLRQLEAFRGVMICGTTKQAAELMNVSQPAVSRLIQDLEYEVGIPLFDRVQGRLLPKPEAHALLQEAEDALSHLDRLDRTIRNSERLKAKPLRIAASAAVTFGVMPQTLAFFKERYPQTSVSLRITTRWEARDWIDAQSFDVAVSLLPVDYPAHKREPLVRVRGVCVLPADHPLGRKETIHARDLDGMPFISLLPETVARARLDKIFADLDVNRDLAVDTQTSSALCLLVQAGLGIGVIDPFTAQRFAQHGVLVRRFEPCVEYEYGLLYPIHSRKSEIVTDFATILRDAIGDFQEHIIA